MSSNPYLNKFKLKFKYLTSKLNVVNFIMRKELKLFLFVAIFFILLKGYIFFYISPSILTNPNMGYNFIVK